MFFSDFITSAIFDKITGKICQMLSCHLVSACNSNMVLNDLFETFRFNYIIAHLWHLALVRIFVFKYSEDL